MMPSVMERGRNAFRHPLAAATMLLLVYLLGSLALDPDGYLGTDTGAKVYTLEVMDRTGSAEPIIGYWAEEHDPDASLHPVSESVPADGGGWVAVTTLPMLEAARPLYAVGGYRAALLLPMLGGVGAAFASRSIARSIGGARDEWLVFWLIGLGSPIAVYSLDFWEHAPGVALMLGAVALLIRDECRPSWGLAVAAGFLLGAAATMRTESFVYAAAAVGAVVLSQLARRFDIRSATVTGVSAVVGFSMPWGANRWLEQELGGRSREARVTGTAGRVGSQVSERLSDAVQTFVGLNSGSAGASAMLGVVVVVVIVLMARAEARQDLRFVRFGLAGVAAVYVADALGGLGFIPGLLVAFPITALALVPRWGSKEWPVIVIAVAALPLVWSFQLLGGAAPQWAGRYSLTSCILLGIVAVVRARDRWPTLARGMVALSFGVTALGVALLVVRTHAISELFRELAVEGAPVVIARDRFVLREGGPFLIGQRWLSSDNEDSFVEAVKVARAVGEPTFSVLTPGRIEMPQAAVPTHVVEIRRTVLWFLGEPYGLVTYRFTE